MARPVLFIRGSFRVSAAAEALHVASEAGAVCLGCGATAISDFAEHVPAFECGHVRLMRHRCSGIRDVSRPLVDVARHVVHTERRNARRTRTDRLDVASVCALDVAHRLVALPSVRIGKSFVPFACECPLVVVAEAFVLRLA